MYRCAKEKARPYIVGSGCYDTKELSEVRGLGVPPQLSDHGDQERDRFSHADIELLGYLLDCLPFEEIGAQHFPALLGELHVAKQSLQQPPQIILGESNFHTLGRWYLPRLPEVNLDYEVVPPWLSGDDFERPLGLTPLPFSVRLFRVWEEVVVELVL